jgi:diadenosine tetraphosphatase ApaH/serine/threonine PP2A family protein phosphatase
MRALIISDIHGNLHALEAVLEATQAHEIAFDAVWNLGDMVGYGARPNEVLGVLRQVGTLHVRGNHDRVCCGLTSPQGFNPIAAEAAVWTKAELTADNLEWLRACAMGPLYPVGQAAERAMCAHGSPLHEDHYIVSMRDAWVPLQKMQTEITFFGHTHVQGSFSRREMDWEEQRPQYAGREGLVEQTVSVLKGSRHLINPGSVGQPRDYDWRAAFAVYDEEAETVTFYRVPYDVEAAQAAILKAGLPERLATRLGTGR